MYLCVCIAYDPLADPSHHSSAYTDHILANHSSASSSSSNGGAGASMYYTQNSHHAYCGLPDQDLIATSTLLAPTATRNSSYMTHNHTHNTIHSRSHSNSITDHNNIGHSSDPNESTLNTTAIRQMAALADDSLAMSDTLPNTYLNYDPNPYGGHNSEGGGAMQHVGEYSQYDMQQYYMHLQNM